MDSCAVIDQCPLAGAALYYRRASQRTSAANERLPEEESCVAVLIDFPRRTGLILLMAVALGAVLRLQGIGDALNHDEVYTWEAFASRSYATIATHYPVPNNPILTPGQISRQKYHFCTSPLVVWGGVETEIGVYYFPWTEGDDV